MRMILMAMTLALSAGIANAGDAGRPDPPRRHADPGSCAAVAVSLEKKDAWGAQSLKDTCEAAENDALHVCEKILAGYGFHDGRCTVKSSRDWVVGIYCRTEDGRASPGIGTGRSPAEAATNAFREAGHAQAIRCWAPAIRHGSIVKETFITSNWHIRTSCGSASAYGTLKGFNALSVAMRGCGRTPVASCRVSEASYR